MQELVAMLDDEILSFEFASSFDSVKDLLKRSRGGGIWLLSVALYISISSERNSSWMTWSHQAIRNK